MEYLNVLISNTELYVPVNEKLGKAMLLAYKRLNYQKHISRLRRPQQNYAETGRIELNSDFFYALEDVLDEQGNHNILHHHFETFSLEERKMLYELFREDKTIRFLVIVRGYQAEYVLNTIRKFFEELKKKI